MTARLLRRGGFSSGENRCVNVEDGTVVVLRRRAAEVGCGCHGWNAADVWSCDGDALVARGGCCCAEQASRRRGGVRQICCNGVECLLAVVRNAEKMVAI